MVATCFGGLASVLICVAECFASGGILPGALSRIAVVWRDALVDVESFWAGIDRLVGNRGSLHGDFGLDHCQAADEIKVAGAAARGCNLGGNRILSGRDFHPFVPLDHAGDGCSSQLALADFGSLRDDIFNDLWKRVGD